MTEHFEARHLELREAAGRVDHRVAYDPTNARPQLEAFEARTGPLVDDLVAAVREVIAWKSGYDPIDGRSHRELDVPTQAMADCLAALDEAARG